MKLEELLNSVPETYSRADRELIERAYRIAENAHSDQKRASGEPYFVHCFSVAKSLAEMCVPPPVVAAGLLHDTVEDTEITLDDLERDFGKEIAQLVGAVTKLTSLPRVSRGDRIEEGEDEKTGLENDRKRRSQKVDLASENLRKTLLAIADDPRVVLIKLADRLHNMRTLEFMPHYKQKRIAQETMDIFAPLASRLGIWKMKWELEDMSFRYVNPDMYMQIADNLTARRSDREKNVNAIIKLLYTVVEQTGLKDVVITGRPKHIYSIYQKMIRKSVP
ncbi:MAG: HD domain-containing protein, partial [Chloroflexota bacterium]|nr:HD domain-containing protein [Chloroflexota bacterium]